MNKFIKEQLKRAQVIIKYPDGQEVDLDNVTNCEFIIERVERKYDVQTWPEIVLKRKEKK